jgi:hypothetical protein
MNEPRAVQASGDPEIISIVPPFLNIQFNASRFGGLPSLARILSQCRSGGCQTLVIEKIPNTGSLAEDDSDLIASGVGFQSSEAIRISFFREEVAGKEALNSLAEESFIGYAIIKTNHFTKSEQRLIFESVLCRSRFRNNFLHGRHNYKVLVCDRIFPVLGNLYCQQNNVTNVCAHVALRTALSALLPDGDMTYREINQILASLGEPHGPGQPLSEDQILSVISAKGFLYYIRKFKESEEGFNLPYRKYVYGSIESGYPALLGFVFPGGSSGHIIPVLGHTFNEDTC